ncbi:hypothetical protein RND81_10G058200 [Saponaria officinalis]|uniref:Ubiquitin-like protease family profile domain-containing protein n=1 Tax=Saponaria officinalis TaxID=3572 RepID=A0AAW1I0T9_SAPOF
MSSFFAPTSNNAVDFKLLRAAENVMDILRSDWCSYIIDSLVTAGVDSKKNHTHVLGCIPLLMITYFQRFDYRGQICASDLPLIKHWDESRLKNRAKGKIADGGLGRQTWSFVKYLRSIHGPTDTHVMLVASLRGTHLPFTHGTRYSIAKIKQLSTDNAGQEGFVPSQFTQDFWHSEELHRFCDNVESEAQRLKESVSNAPGPQDARTCQKKVTRVNDIATQQLRDVMDNFRKNGFSAEIRDSAATASGSKQTSEFTTNETAQGGVADPTVPDGSIPCSENKGKSGLLHTPVNESEGLKAINDEVPDQNAYYLPDEFNQSGAFYNTAEINEVLLREENGSPVLEETNTKSMEDLDRAILEEVGYTAAEVESSIQLVKQSEDSNSAPTSDNFQQPITVHHPLEQQSVSALTWTGEGTCKRRRTSTTNRATLVAAIVNFQPNGPLSPLSSKRRGKGDGLGCSLDCGQTTGASLLVVSNFLRNNMALFRNIKDWRKHVAGYCFLDDGDLPITEDLVEYGPNARLQRNDILSMLPNRLTSSSVIECWALLLNKIESEDNQTQRMAFFGLRHTEFLNRMMETSTQTTPSDSVFDVLYKDWDNYLNECGSTINLDADFIFVPILIEDHMACVCLNFKSQTADILDNQTHNDQTKSYIVKAAKIIVAAMSDYLEYRGIDKGGEVTRFAIRLIMFDWTRSRPNKEESGIFTMVHMLMYEGKPFDHDDLGSKINRRYLVIQIAASLILADMNKIRPKVMENVSRWVSRKDSILVTLKAKRRLIQILTKSRSSN